MGSGNKFLALTFIVLVLFSLMIFSVNSVNVYATPKPAPKPSVPQFTVKIVDNSYDVPPSTTTDPYTGVTTTKPGYHVDQRDIEVTIKKQPFTIYTEEGYIFRLHYRVEVKGHFGNDWTTFYDYNAQLNSDTVVTRSANDYDEGTQLDFRVQAIIKGYMENGPFATIAPDINSESSWSKTQTITIPSKPSASLATQTTDSPNTPTTSDPYSPPQQNSSASILLVTIVATCIITILLVIIIYQYTQRKTHPFISTP